MAAKFQSVPHGAAASYPSAIAWSEENLIAVASGHLVTIINPALPSGPRGSITIASSEPHAIGRIKKEDLLCSKLFPIALSRDRRPCVRSVSWSPVGMASNSGCLIAVCTTEGRVKLYRPPYCDFCAEWIQVIDVSDMLYRYLMETNFGESSSDGALETQGFSNDLALALYPSTAQKRKRANSTLNSCTSNKLSNPEYDGNIDLDSIHGTENKVTTLSKKVGGKYSKSQKEICGNSIVPTINSERYCSRSALVTSLVVAWSPLINLSSKKIVALRNFPSRCSLLAVGGESGNISFWKINAPQEYSVENSKTPITLAQLVQAHSSWVTTISFSVVGCDFHSNVVLASGSSDGSVKIWIWKRKDDMESLATSIYFSILHEVLPENYIPVSVVSLSLAFQSCDETMLAIGKGSGMLEVWKFNALSSTFNKIGSFKAHDFIVTGLAWAPGCLYSCSQDNYIRSWSQQNETFSEVPLPASTPDIKGSLEVTDVFLSCQGVSVSPGNLVLVAVRNFDVEQLNPMYQASAQRAAVEFFWVGGAQQLDIHASSSVSSDLEVSSTFSTRELSNWEYNIIQALKEFENVERPLVLWDVIQALLSFNRSVPDYVDNLLINWVSKIFVGEASLSMNDLWSNMDYSFSKVSSRRLHLLNVICRRVILSEFQYDGMEKNGMAPSGGEKPTKWIKLLFNSEKELRERLVFITLSSFLLHSAKSTNNCGSEPRGVFQMEQWVLHNTGALGVQVQQLASEVGKHRRLQPNKLHDDQCGYCSASVPFESPEFALCQGSETINGVTQKHKLSRCAVSMMVCPVTLAWICKCCNRSVSVLAPPSLFTISSFPDSLELSEELTRPLCPFCGILLQRWQPEFLPSVSPV